LVCAAREVEVKMKRARPRKHKRRLRSGRCIIVNQGVKKKPKRRNYGMAVTYNAPRWLLKQLNPNQRKDAERMLLDEGRSQTEVAEHFNIKDPWTGVSRRPRITWNREQKLSYIKKLGGDLGRAPTGRELGDDAPDQSAFGREFGSWNKAVRLAGFHPKNKDPRYKPIRKRMEQYGLEQIPLTPAEENRHRSLDWYGENRERQIALHKISSPKWRASHPGKMRDMMRKQEIRSSIKIHTKPEVRGDLLKSWPDLNILPYVQDRTKGY